VISQKNILTPAASTSQCLALQVTEINVQVKIKVAFSQCPLVAVRDFYNAADRADA
jgi:hypothetical protein